DVNAAVNIKVAGGHSETLNGRGGKRKTSVKEAASREASTPFSDHSKKVAWGGIAVRFTAVRMSRVVECV
ncbi:MAG: hypothetical protein PX637_24795, partial [Microcystis sp. M53601_WE4]|nr:hypothetical protein [Microcystis sp. M53601_WE4]